MNKSNKCIVNNLSTILPVCETQTIKIEVEI